MRGALEDMQGRFNLNNLLTDEGKVNEAEVARFERLLDAGRRQPALGAHRGGLARRRIRWPASRKAPRTATYLSQNPPYLAANGPVTTTTELMALPGMTYEEYLRIRPYVAALPLGTKINVCTASAPVLAALVEGSTDFGDADSLAANRKNGCFPTLQDLQATLSADEYQAIQLDKFPNLRTGSAP